MTNPPSQPGAKSVKRVLVVEDDPLVRHALLRQLDRAFAVESAAGADAAIKLLNTKRFDLVLSDYAMPDGNGVALARHLRKAGFKAPIVLLTAVPTAPDIPEALQAGVIQAVVPKPWNYRDLVQLLSDRLAAPRPA